MAEELIQHAKLRGISRIKLGDGSDEKMTAINNRLQTNGAQFGIQFDPATQYATLL